MERRPLAYELARTEARHLVFLSADDRGGGQRAIEQLNPPAICQKFSDVPLRLEGQRANRSTVILAPRRSLR